MAFHEIIIFCNVFTFFPRFHVTILVVVHLSNIYIIFSFEISHIYLTIITQVPDGILVLRLCLFTSHCFLFLFFLFLFLLLLGLFYFLQNARRYYNAKSCWSNYKLALEVYSIPPHYCRRCWICKPSTSACSIGKIRCENIESLRKMQYRYSHQNFINIYHQLKNEESINEAFLFTIYIVRRVISSILWILRINLYDV